MSRLYFRTTELMNKLSSLQNKALRIIHFKSQRDQTRPLYIQSKILTISQMLKLKNCLFANDHAKNQLLEHFENFFKKMGHQHDHLTRNSK